MPTIEVDDETLERLDQIRLEDESYDEVITELINIYEAEGLTLHRSGD
jgi:predicted CopG family antitoxin